MAGQEEMEALGLHPKLIKNLGDVHSIKDLTNVQKKAFPVLLAGKDALVRSPTGSGKTLSYLLPMVQNLGTREKKIQRSDGVYALILAPTRELCIQIEAVLQKLVKPFIWLIPGSVMGGNDKHKEKARLRKGVTILIGTPGRLLDHLKSTQALNVTPLQWLIFDEADRLLDMGFEDVVCEIVNLTESKRDHSNRRICALVSATLRKGFDRIVKVSLMDPVKVGFEATTAALPEIKKVGADKKTKTADLDDCEDREDVITIPKELSQWYSIVPCKQRLVCLASFLHWKCGSGTKCKIIVFVSSCDSADFHYEILSHARKPGSSPDEDEDGDDNDEEGKAKGDLLLNNITFSKLHGNMPQVDRSETFQTFVKATHGVLLCTDAAARGLDFPAVDWIVQYDPPMNEAEYIHRVGRTARIHHKGNALLFLMESESKYVDRIVQKHPQMVLRCLEHEDLLHSINKMTETSDRRKRPGEKKKRPDVVALASYLLNGLEMQVSKTPELHQLAKKAFNSYSRAYSTYGKEMKDIFHVKQLHLGHVAKSFALKETPSQLGRTNQSQRKDFKTKPTKKNMKRNFGGEAGDPRRDMDQPRNKRKLQAGRDMVPEFDSGDFYFKKKSKK